MPDRINANPPPSSLFPPFPFPFPFIFFFFCYHILSGRPSVRHSLRVYEVYDEDLIHSRRSNDPYGEAGGGVSGMRRSWFKRSFFSRFFSYALQTRVVSRPFVPHKNKTHIHIYIPFPAPCCAVPNFSSLCPGPRKRGGNLVKHKDLFALLVTPPLGIEPYTLHRIPT